MSRASSLHRLQQLELELEAAESRMAEIDRRLADSEPVRKATAAHAAAEAALQTARHVAHSAELDAETVKAKLAAAEAALYGGTVRNPKELQDLQADCESLKRHIATLEDSLLERMVELDEAATAESAAAKALDDVQAQEITGRAGLSGERTSLMSRVERLQAECEAALASVNPPDVATYRALRQSKAGKAVSLLVDGSCGACGLTLAPSLQQTLRSGGDLMRCPQCARILYAG
jgi:predicted  nucleic acid-binding Zn-ribbon protein